MSLDEDVDLDELEDYSPENIAAALFNQEPKDPLTCRLVAESDIVDSVWLFELLITIFMEGMEIIIGDLSIADLKNLSMQHIIALNPWFHSLGFNISVDIWNKGEDLEEYKDYYCKIIVKDKINEIIFEHKNVDKNYHFLLNGPCLKANKEKTNVKDLYAILINNDNTVFKINFQFYIPLTINTKLL